jgi:hypothetical protein
VDSRRDGARTALRLIAAAADGDEAADSLLVDAFRTADEAALDHAYLSGFLILLLADAWSTTPPDAVKRVAGLLEQA